MASENSIINPFEFLQIVLNQDGSLTRLDPRPTIPSNGMVNETALGFFKDVSLDDFKGTSLRLFLPLDQTPEKKLPVIVYCHGGGGILQSAAGKSFHDLCMSMAARCMAVVVSVDYRLAPENRLPAAYEDTVDALLWIQQQALGAYVDPWISRYSDVSKCFIMGGSAGGNIAYNAALRSLDLDLKPMKIIGLILSQPFFSGVQRTESELRLTNDRVLPLAAADLMWELALPVGVNRDHVYCNPLITRGKSDKKIKNLPSCLLTGYAGDPLVDRQRMFESKLMACRVHVTSIFREGGIHAAEVFDPAKFQVLLDDVKAFISSIVEGGRQNINNGPHQYTAEKATDEQENGSMDQEAT